MSPCGGVITSPQTFTTPNFPSYYGTNLDCVWLVDFSESGQQVQVTFEDLQFDSADCTQDYVKILNGHLPTSPELGVYCGGAKPTNPIRSQSSYLWIQFHSDGISGSSRGVSITVDSVASGKLFLFIFMFYNKLILFSKGCGGILHSPTGSLSSPNYPSAYAANMECEWEVRVDPGYVVIASFFQRFDLENSTNCQNDFVQVF